MSETKNYFKPVTSSGDNELVIGGTITPNSGITTAFAILGVATSTAINSTPAEIDLQCDVSAQTETIIGAGAVSVVKRLSNLALVGAGAVTLAAPGATMLGMVKVITMTVDNGDVTLALTNVQGGSAASTATFSAVGQQLVLVGASAKWTVVGQGGVVLS